MKSRLLFVSEFYLGGGLERFLIDLLGGLDRERFDIDLLLKAPGLAERLRASLPDHIRVHEPRLFTVQDWQDSLGETAWPAWLKLLPRAVLRLLRDASFLVNQVLLRRQFSRLRPDHLEIINGGYPGGMVCLAAGPAARRSGVRSVDMTVLSYPFPRRLSAIDRAIDRVVSDNVDSVTANSRATQGGLAALRGFPENKLRTIYTGIEAVDPTDPDRVAALGRSWRRGPEDILIGMLSVFVPIKGHEHLLEAAKLVAPRWPRARWVLAGDGPTRPAMQALARRLGLEDRVIFPGRYKGAGSDVGAALDIVVHPSVQESFPYAVLEAMRASKPIIASRIAGIPEQIEDGVSGLLVTPGDSLALAGAMERLLRAPETARGLGDAARRRFLERFTAASMHRAFAESFLGRKEVR